MHIIPYDTESKSRNADFISIARRAIHNPRPERPSNLRTLRTFGAQPRQSSRHRRVQWRSQKGGGERSEPIRRMLIMPYDTARSSRNADFISVARRAIHNLRPEGPSNLRTLRPSGRSILRTFSPEGQSATTEPGGAQGRLFHKKNSPFGESIHKGEDAYLSLVRQRPRSQLRRKRRRCSISGVEGSSCSISRMASFSFRPERKMRRYAFFR